MDGWMAGWMDGKAQGQRKGKKGRLQKTGRGFMKGKEERGSVDGWTDEQLDRYLSG